MVRRSSWHTWSPSCLKKPINGFLLFVCTDQNPEESGFHLECTEILQVGKMCSFQST